MNELDFLIASAEENDALDIQNADMIWTMLAEF